MNFLGLNTLQYQPHSQSLLEEDILVIIWLILLWRCRVNVETPGFRWMCLLTTQSVNLQPLCVCVDASQQPCALLGYFSESSILFTNPINKQKALFLQEQQAVLVNDTRCFYMQPFTLLFVKVRAQSEQANLS